MSPRTAGTADETAPVGTSTRPGRGRPGYDRATVIERAIDIFTRYGYEGTSMDTLAKELGISKSAVYHHVDSKEDLLRQALDQGLDALASAVAEEGKATSGGALERLRRAVRRSVLILIEHQNSVTLLLRVHGNSDVERRAVERRRDIDTHLSELVAAAIEEGDVRDDISPVLATRLLFGMVNSLTEWYRPGPGRDPEGVADAVVAIAFNGLTTR